MANKPCPKCGVTKWWWRDETGCNVCNPEEHEVACEHGIEKCVYCNDKPGVSEMLEANGLVNGDRQADYGTPRENYAGVAKVFSGILSQKLKADITPEEAALMMVGLKLQRQAMKHKRDNLVDAHGYLLVYAHIRGDGDVPA